MTTHDSESEVSESELAGKLGASLTPRVPRITVQHRGEQSSGLFDLGALYAAASVDQVMKRARTVRDQPPVVGIAEIVAPVQESPLHPWPRASVRQEAPAGEFEADPEPELAVRARGTGWFGVAGAWFAVALIGAAVATMMLPGPTFARARAAASAAVARVRGVAGAPVAVTAAPPALPTPPALAAPPVLPSPPTLPASAPSTTSVLAAAHPVVATPEPAPAAPPKKAAPATYARPRPAVRSAPADAPAPTPPPAKAAAIAETPAPKAVVPSTPATQPAAGGDSSLEAMMRRAVEADAKRR
jgi:hypothetical protein